MSAEQPVNGVPLTDRLEDGFRLGVITAVLIAIVGLLDWALKWPFLQSTVGPTTYVFIAHPHQSTSRLRNAAIGHLTAVTFSLAALAVFGLWNQRSESSLGHVTFLQAMASVVAIAATLFVLEVVGSHHAPSAATALLITTGLARPGKPFGGLVLGLVIAIVLGPLASRIPLFQREATEQ